MDGGKTIEWDLGGLQADTAVCPQSGPAEQDLDPELAGRSPLGMPASKGREDLWAGTDAGRGMTHLTVYARAERSAPMQPVYVVDGARGKLYVRACSESWRPRAERLEVALNKGRDSLT
jgi:hypothetical protein